MREEGVSPDMGRQRQSSDRLSEAWYLVDGFGVGVWCLVFGDWGLGSGD